MTAVSGGRRPCSAEWAEAEEVGHAETGHPQHADPENRPAAQGGAGPERGAKNVEHGSAPEIKGVRRGLPAAI